MRAARPGTIYCPHCHVTAPPELKQCRHCGGRLISDVPGPLELRLAMARAGGEAPTVIEMEADSAADAGEEPGTPPSSVRRGLTVVWVAIALIPVLYRACN